jgi:sn-glycerol 3-phosphate transport system permease protein
MSATASATIVAQSTQSRARLAVRIREISGRVGLYAALALASVAVIFPIYLLAVLSIMPAAEASTYPPALFTTHPTLDHFRAVFITVPMLRYIANSLIVSTSITAGHLIFACLAAYAFAFLRFPGRQVIFLVFMAALMVPAEVSLVPNYLTINALGWRNTYQALAVPFLATAFGTFLLRQFFLSIPRELADAASIDGCGHMRFLRQIIVPLSRPALATLAVTSFLVSWNMYLWPLIVSDRATTRTVQIGIRALENGEALDRGLVAAGALIALIPTILVLLIAQRQIVRGLTAGALKG